MKNFFYVINFKNIKMPLELDKETIFWNNMRKVYREIEQTAIDHAKFAKQMWSPDSDPEIIKRYTKEYYDERCIGDNSYFFTIFNLEIDRLFNK